MSFGVATCYDWKVSPVDPFLAWQRDIPDDHVTSCTLWLFNSLPWYRWPTEIDGLPFLKIVDLSMSMSNNQMVTVFKQRSLTNERFSITMFDYRNVNTIIRP
jgi:hypothetical protein